MKILNKEIPSNIEEIYKNILSDCPDCKISIRTSSNSLSTTRSNYFNQFTISIIDELEEDYFWETFLHEHVHIVQTMAGYKDMEMCGCGNSIDRIIQTTNNCIMDIDVYNRLYAKYKFEITSNQGKNTLFNGIKNQIEIYHQTGLNDNEAKFISAFTAYFTLQHDECLGNKLAQELKILNNNFIKYHNGLINIIISNYKIGYKHVRQMQTQAMDLFSLRCYRFV